MLTTKGKMKTTKDSKSPLAKTDGIVFKNAKHIISRMVSRGSITRQDVARKFSIDTSTVSAGDCMYKYVLEELERERVIESFKDGNSIKYREPVQKLF